MAEMHDNYNLSVDDQYYLLLNDRNGEKRDKGRSALTSSVSRKKFVSLLKGEILTQVREKDQPKDETLIRLTPIERRSVTLECPTREVQRIDYEEANLLLPLCSVSERLKVFRERNRLKFGKKMNVDSEVWVDVSVSGVKRGFQGVIRYKGQIPGTPGTMFGVELLNQEGRGSTDGSFKGKQYFCCKKDSGVFVSLERLTPRASKSTAKSSGDSEINREENMVNGDSEENKDEMENKESLGTSSLTNQSIINSIEKEIEHKEGDVVWVYIGDKPKRGIIKYIGRMPGDKLILAGIRLDQKCGRGDGEYHGKRLFVSPYDYAHFTPITNVISEKMFGEMYKPPDGHRKLDLKEKPSSSTQQSSDDDIVQMESSFTNRSKEDIIKEQKEFLEKAKAEALSQRQTGSENIDVNSRDTVNHIKDQNKKICSSSKPETLFEKAQVGQTGIHVRNNHEKSVQSPTEHRFDHGSSAALERKDRVSIPRDLSGTSTSRVSYGAPKHGASDRPGRSIEGSHEKLDIGSMVEVLSKVASPKYGVIRWIGFTPNSNKKVAGLELEEEMEACSDGTFLGRRYFTCPPKRGFFVHLHNCQPDSRFRSGNSLTSNDRRLTGIEFGSFDSPVITDQLVPPAESLEVYTRGGGPRGVQGHHNSCYLDATLFAAFAFSSVMDSILLREKNEKDIEQYDKVQRVLRDKIVYPLRDNGFVRADRVLELRQLLDQLGTVAGLVGEEKDPEEFLLTLLQQVMKTEPFLKIKIRDPHPRPPDVPLGLKHEVRHEYFYQVLADKDVERVLPSVEELLKRSFHESDLKLTEVPSCLIVQMPRFGKGFKMYNRILPSLTINIGELVDGAPQDCAVCGYLARYHCKDCFSVTGFTENDSSGNFCKDCNERIHSHVRRMKHKPYPLVVSREICAHYAKKAVEHQEMELFAVVCIETSHYVTFAKCKDAGGEDKWCFFDSMADRVGTKDGYNIPAVTECPEVIEWLSSEKQNRERIINTDDKEMPDKVRRLLGDAYMCLYQSVEMSMYK